MPRLTRFAIRTALLYLAAGFTAGGLMLFNKGVPVAPSWWRLLPLHVEFVLIGWTVQLAMGVAFWILPRFAGGPARGTERLAWSAYLLLNIGVLSAGLGQWLGGPPIVSFAGRVTELLAVLTFALHVWPRVKPLGA